MTTTTLPLIDISRFRAPGADRAEFLAELRHAAHDVGFFYVVGHGVPEELMTGIFDVARRFFELPLDQRLAIENLNSPQFRGYTRVGTEHTAGAPDWREQIDIGPERAARQLQPALLQQDDVGGLQVQAEDGSWIDATPVPGAFVFNIGEMLEIATQGYLTATRHRVISPPTGVKRLSVPFFLGPRLDAVVEPLQLPPELAAASRGVSADKDNPLLAAFGENAVVGWLRSHPRVAARWWPDL